MTDAVNDELMLRFKPLLQKLEYLHDRWQDESEYEDWKDYVDFMRKLAPPDTEFHKASKRPFGFEVRTKAGNGFRFCCSAKQAWFDVLTISGKGN
jgi:hypothetical protein